MAFKSEERVLTDHFDGFSMAIPRSIGAPGGFGMHRGAGEIAAVVASAILAEKAKKWTRKRLVASLFPLGNLLHS